MMMDDVVSLGYGNAVMRERVVAVVSSSTSPVKRMIGEARRHNKLIDATNGRRTRTVVITDSDHLILSSAQPVTLIERFALDKKSKR